MDIKINVVKKEKNEKIDPRDLPKGTVFESDTGNTFLCCGGGKYLGIKFTRDDCSLIINNDFVGWGQRII